MKKKNKFIIFVINEIAFLFIIFIVIPTLFIKERPGIYQTKIQQISSLDSKHSFVQEVITDQNNLNTVSVLLKNPSLINQSKINLEILDNNHQVLRSLNSSGVSIGDPSWLTFKFPYVNSKIGDHIFIKLTTDNQNADTLYVFSNQDPTSFNFKTFYTVTNLKESFKTNLNNQIQKFQDRNSFYNLAYILTLIILNISLLIIL